MGAGVEWRVASFWARERPDPGGEERDGERVRKSVTRKDPLPVQRWPWLWDFGHSDGTAEWMASREACSPGKGVSWS